MRFNFIREIDRYELDSKLQLLGRGENCARMKDKCSITVDHDLSYKFPLKNTTPDRDMSLQLSLLFSSIEQTKTFKLKIKFAP